MGDYISREAVLALGYWHGEHPDFDHPNPDGVDAVDVSDIETIPAADVVEVVLCCHCMYYDENEMKCLHPCGLDDASPDDFCSYGERRDE